ncbi:MAG TPA: class I SAM-dependent methyltransferase [Pyrinomonadaceae bacterium]|nr:class I SAM-dependent methyltransferase [Pyrinomonadaceae bacterium]
MPFPENGLGQHYDLDADDYFQHHDKDEKIENARSLVQKAEELLGRRGKILDVGVGRGEILLVAKERGWDVSGVEPSETFADYAEKHTGARIWRQPVEDAELPDGEFDVIILGAVLEHLYDPDKVIENIARALKVGGLLYLDVPNERGLYFRIGNVYQKLRGRKWTVNLAPTFTPFHVIGFSPKSLRLLLSKYSLSPAAWTVYAGTSLVPSGRGIIGFVESVASKLVTALSSVGENGTYIETWARKS